MKIRSLEIENITSLNGRHLINFERILAEDDLFAITGPTGSGKSTLLTCIGLALYGRHYKSALSSADFVTQGKREGKINVEFSVGNKNYRALWSCTILKKNGEPKKVTSPQRVLFQNEHPLELKAEDVLPLDFDQFCKVAILNQGQFSRFLQSSYSDRKEILEKLIQAKNLTALAKRLKSKIEHLEKERENLLHQTSDLHLISDEEYNHSKTKKKGLTTKLQELKKNIELISQLIIHLQEKHSLEMSKVQFIERRGKNKKELKDIIKNINTFEEDYTLFKKQREIKLLQYTKEGLTYKKAIDFQKELNFLVEKINESKKIKEDKVKRLENDQKTFLEYKQVILSAQKKLKEIPQDFLITKVQKKELQLLFDEKAKVQQQQQLHQKELILIEQSRKKQEQDIFKQKEKMSLLEKDKSYLDTQISQSKLKADVSILKELISIESLWPKQINDKNEHQEKLKNLRSQYNEKQNILKLETKKEQKLSIDLNELKSLIDQGSLLQLAAKQLHLHQNQGDCPVCEQTLPEENYQSLMAKREHSNSYLEDKVLAVEKELLKAREFETKAKQQMLYLKDEAQRTKEKIALLDNHIESYIKKTLCLSPKDLSEKISFLNEEKELYLKNELLIIEKDKQLKQARIDLISLEKSSEKIYKREKELSELINISKKVLEKGNQSLGTARSQYTEQNGIDLFREDLKNSEEHNQLMVLIKTRSLDAQILKEHIQTNKDQNKQLDISIKKEESAHLKTKASIKSLDLPFLPESEDIQNYTEELLHIDKCTKELEDKSDKLLKEQRELLIKKERFESTRDSIKEQLQDIELLFIQIDAKVAPLLDDLLKTEKRLEILEIYRKLYLDEIKTVNHIESEKNLPYLETILNKWLRPHIKSLNEEKDITIEQSTQAKELIKNYKAQFLKQEKVKESIKLTEEQLSYWLTLSPFISKDEFRNYVLMLVEEELVWQANQELQSLCDGRYTVLRPDGARKTEYMVRDNWLGGAQRKCSTLSGGETFLLSLSLALGLAELSRGSAEVDCFFIDEGFGTLDKDSIQEVFDALMGLRNRGKQIGIISHVQELTERIPVNIILKKGAFGHSTIDISSESKAFL